MTDNVPAVGRAAPAGPPRDLGRENMVLRGLVTVYRQLSGLALQDADLASVTQLLADRTAATVAVVSPVMDVMAAAAPGTAPEKAAVMVADALVHPRLGQVLRASRQGHRSLWLPRVGGMPAIIVAPILVGDEVPAHLITLDLPESGGDEDMNLLVTEHAATICGVILGREHVVAAAARRVRDDLVEGLLLGRGRDDGDAQRWAAHLGYDPGREHNVMVIAFDVPDPLPERIRVLGHPGVRDVEGDDHHVVLARRVVSEVRRPSLGVAIVAAAPQKQAFNQVVTHAAGGGLDHVLPAEYHPADRGRVLGDEQVHVLIAAALRHVQGDQVRGHLVTDEDRRDNDRRHPADAGQPQGPVPLPRCSQDLAETWVNECLRDHNGGLFRRRAGRRGRHDVHDRTDHGNGRRRPVGQQLGDAGQVRVLQRQARQLAVHRHQLAKDHVLPAEITCGAEWPGWPGRACGKRPPGGREFVRHKRSIRPQPGMVLVARHKPVR